jgi:crossover junction endodeoxyribonuclease RusA
MAELFVLPFPPSANHYWRHPGKGPLAGRHLISEEGRQYRFDVHVAVLQQRVRRQKLTGSISIDIAANPPDKRRRDLDNMLKALLDALTHAGVWDDDSNIDELSIRRGKVVSGGRISIAIRANGVVE